MKLFTFLLLLCTTINGVQLNLRKTSFDSQNKMAISAFMLMENLFNGIIPNNTTINGPVPSEDSSQIQNEKETETKNSTSTNGPITNDTQQVISNDTQQENQLQEVKLQENQQISQVNGPIPNLDEKQILNQENPIQDLIKGNLKEEQLSDNNIQNGPILKSDSLKIDQPRDLEFQNILQQTVNEHDKDDELKQADLLDQPNNDVPNEQSHTNSPNQQKDTQNKQEIKETQQNVQVKNQDNQETKEIIQNQQEIKQEQTQKETVSQKTVSKEEKNNQHNLNQDKQKQNQKYVENGMEFEEVQQTNQIKQKKQNPYYIEDNIVFEQPAIMESFSNQMFEKTSAKQDLNVFQEADSNYGNVDFIQPQKNVVFEDTEFIRS